MNHFTGRRAMSHGRMCFANVDVFGNVQDRTTCYPTKIDANNKSNGYPYPPTNPGGQIPWQGGEGHWIHIPLDAPTTLPPAAKTATGYYPHPYYPFSQEDRHPYYPYTYGDEYAGALSDVTPFGVLIPPVGISQYGRSRSSSPMLDTDWSMLAKVGLGVGAVVAAYLVYRGLRTSVTMSQSALRGAIGGEG
jgi:hypothetical protein